MTPEELQETCEKLGYPWVGMDKDGTWSMFRVQSEKPSLNHPEVWTLGISDSCLNLRHLKIDYQGDWKDSLRGPKEER